MDAAQVPVTAEVREVAATLGLDATQMALSSGEEYELAFTIAPASLPAVQQAVAERGARPVTVIGEVGEGSGVVVQGAQAPPSGGWDHFPGTQR